MLINFACKTDITCNHNPIDIKLVFLNFDTPIILRRAVARNGSVGGVGTNFADRRAWSRVWSWEWLLLCSAAGGGGL